MKIATFNINGVKARIEALLGWLDTSAPDVALLQEIKSEDKSFPRELIEDKGYRVETHGQKGFNGVAILSKLPLEDVTRRLPGQNPDGAPDEQTRWIEATASRLPEEFRASFRDRNPVNRLLLARAASAPRHGEPR